MPSLTWSGVVDPVIGGIGLAVRVHHVQQKGAHGHVAAGHGEGIARIGLSQVGGELDPLGVHGEGLAADLPGDRLDALAEEGFPSVGDILLEPPGALRVPEGDAARDGAVALIRERLQRAAPVSGAEVDRRARAILQQRGLLGHVRHRTGHAIDARLHGIGVNLDAVEFPDPRPLLDGSCFSVEPGVYLREYGMRSEINAYVQDGGLVISGGAPQQAVLLP